jgi:oligosaccharide translocation protein RFT1
VGVLVLPLGLAVTAAATALALYAAGPDAAPGYRSGVALHGAAALLELCGEPFQLVAAAQLRFRLRAGVEAGATLVRCALALALLAGPAPLPPALAFSIAQLASAAVTVAAYAVFGWRLRRAAGLRLPRRWGAPEAAALRLCGWFGLQAGEKLLLAEGGKLVLVAAQSRANVGAYGLVANLGSLAVRMLLQPLNEAAFLAFSRRVTTARARLPLRRPACHRRAGCRPPLAPTPSLQCPSHPPLRAGAATHWPIRSGRSRWRMRCRCCAAARRS